MIHKPGWMLQRTLCNNVEMTLGSQWSKVPVRMLPKLRQVVSYKEHEYTDVKEHNKLLANTRLFRELDSRAAAYTTPLMHQFLAASSAYSCATPDNRIKLHVEQLEVIQNKDNKLREEESAKIEKIIEKSKSKLKETQDKIDNMNSKLNMLRMKIQNDKKKSVGPNGRLTGIENMPDTISERASEFGNNSIFRKDRDSILETLTGQNSEKRKDRDRSSDMHNNSNNNRESQTTNHMMTVLERNLKEARKSIHMQESFIAQIEATASFNGLDQSFRNNDDNK